MKRFLLLVLTLFIGGGLYAQGDITFKVDMTQYTGPTYSGVYMNSSAGGWCGDCAPLDDTDGDGIWEGTYNMPAGAQEFKFSIDGWDAQENLTEGDPCTTTNGGFTNRVIEVTGNAVLDPVCWNSCEVCGLPPDMASITMNVNMSQYTVSADGLYLAGGSAFNTPGDNPMTDPDGDGIYSITLMRPVGTTSNYTFVNGSGWGDKENIEGLPCADSGNFNDRLPITINQDTVINTCFAECTDDTNCTPINMVSITMNVNMSQFTVSPDGVSLAGGSAFGQPGDNPMLDPDGDGIYSVTLMRAAGTTSTYTFVNGDWWDDKEDIGGQPCADPNNFDDRLAITINQDTVINTCFQECTDDLDCTPVATTDDMITFSVDMNEYTGPTYTAVYVNGMFNGWCGDCNPLEDADMDGVWEGTYEVPTGLTEFKYTLDGWTAQESLTEGDPCTNTVGAYTNRSLEVDGDAVLPTVCWESCDACGAGVDGNITFSVDMNEYVGIPITTVYVSGTFNGWAGEDNPLADDDMDGVWEATYAIPEGDIEFKYQIDGWMAEETFVGGESCTVTNGGFVNRALTVSGDAVLPTVCFNSCDACGVVPDMVSITMNVNMNQYTVSADGVSLAGGTGFGTPGDNPMLDPDGDGIYSITLMRPVGFTSNYTFINGSGWGDKENIAGLPCADPDNFDDRLPITVNQDTVINTCFAECTDDTNCTPVNMVSITMNLNMNQYTVSSEGVFLAGGTAFGGPNDNPMEDPDGDGIYTITLMRAAGTTSHYTFVNGDWWDDKEDIAGLPCSDPGNFDDRLAITFDQDTVINTCFQECTDDLECTPVAAPVSVTFQVNMQDETTNAGGVFLGADFDGWSGGLAMEDTDGDDVWTLTMDVPQGLAEFKFINGPDWVTQEELDETEDAACTMTTSGYTNRILDVTGSDAIVLDIVCYNSCLNCIDIGTKDILSENTIFRLAPSLTNGTPVMLYFNESSKEQRTLRITNTIGQVVYQAAIGATAAQHAIETADLSNGLYYVMVESDQEAAIEKFIVSK